MRISDAAVVIVCVLESEWGGEGVDGGCMPLPRPGDSYWVLYCIYNTCKYWVYPILTMVIVIFPIQYNTIIFFEKIVKFLGRSNRQVKNKSREEEEDKVRWMRRMRRDRFFRKCRKKVKKKRMRSGR